MNYRLDLYYMRIAKEAGWKSQCFSRQIGAVLVNPQANSIIGTGYNGPAANTAHCDQDGRYDTLKAAAIAIDCTDALIGVELGRACPRQLMHFKSGKGLELCVAAHAERNAILNAAKVGARTLGSTLYCYCGIPCKDCAIELINAGVKRVVHIRKDKYYDEVAAILFEQAEVVLNSIEEDEVLATYTETPE